MNGTSSHGAQTIRRGWRIVCTSIVIALVSFLFCSSVSAQSTENVRTVSDIAHVKTSDNSWQTLPTSAAYLSVLGVIVGILSLIVAVVVLIFAGGTIFQLRREREVIRDLEAQYKKKLATLGGEYLPPAELLEKAQQQAESVSKKIRETYDPRIDDIRVLLAKLRAEQEQWSGEQLKQRNIHTREIASNMSEFRSEIRRKPDINTVLVHIGEKYRTPRDLEGGLLRKVLNAFIKVSSIPQEELKAITKELVPDEKDAASGGE